MSKKVIIVEGVIGSGKSIFTKQLGAALGDTTLLLMEPDEKNDANPYLAMFYSDRARWSYTMQTHLLAARFKMHLLAQWHAMHGYGHAILDRSYFGDTAFARLQVNNGDMNEREFKTYTSIYHAMTAFVLLPNICVRLLVQPETANYRIQKRMEEQTGRKCESAIDLSYLIALDKEITHMASVLERQGVKVISLAWDADRDATIRQQDVESIAIQIEQYEPSDLFLDLHRRTI